MNLNAARLPLLLLALVAIVTKRSAQRGVDERRKVLSAAPFAVADARITRAATAAPTDNITPRTVPTSGLGLRIEVKVRPVLVASQVPLWRYRDGVGAEKSGRPLRQPFQ